MRSTNQANQLCFLSLAVFRHFDTFPDGWVGGWVVEWVGKKSRIKTNSAQLKLKLRLSLAKNIRICMKLDEIVVSSEKLLQFVRK